MGVNVQNGVENRGRPAQPRRRRLPVRLQQLPRWRARFVRLCAGANLTRSQSFAFRLGRKSDEPWPGITGSFRKAYENLSFDLTARAFVESESLRKFGQAKHQLPPSGTDARLQSRSAGFQPAVSQSSRRRCECQRAPDLALPIEMIQQEETCSRVSGAPGASRFVNSLDRRPFHEGPTGELCNYRGAVYAEED